MDTAAGFVFTVTWGLFQVFLMILGGWKFLELIGG